MFIYDSLTDWRRLDFSICLDPEFCIDFASIEIVYF